jgi:hypothetical protein
MLRKRLLLILVFFFFAVDIGFSADCDSIPPKQVNLTLWSSSRLFSPDQQWAFLSVAPHSSDQKAVLSIQNAKTSKRWFVGWTERNGTAFWSRDSKRLFLRDEYAADDTKIRVFDVTREMPQEINGLNEKIQIALFAHIPKNETTQWLYYPKVCFAADDSSTIIVLADAPLVPKTGSGSGVPFELKLTVNVVTQQIIAAVPTAR